MTPSSLIPSRLHYRPSTNFTTILYSNGFFVEQRRLEYKSIQPEATTPDQQPTSTATLLR